MTWNYSIREIGVEWNLTLCEASALATRSFPMKFYQFGLNAQ